MEEYIKRVEQIMIELYRVTKKVDTMHGLLRILEMPRIKFLTLICIVKLRRLEKKRVSNIMI